MTPETRKDYWFKALEQAERAVEVARREYLKARDELGMTAMQGADDMLAGEQEHVSNDSWPGA